MAQFHFDPDTYLEMIRTEVPDYDTLQAEIGRATRSVRHGAPRVLDLGAGTGSTSNAVLARGPRAARARRREPGDARRRRETCCPPRTSNEVVIADLSDPAARGSVRSRRVGARDPPSRRAPAKRALFRAVHDRLRAGGRFVMADVVVPDDPADAVTPLTPDYDKPDRADDVLAWLQAAGFRAEITWSARDLAVFVADK